jgi:hypothetical protein
MSFIVLFPFILFFSVCYRTVNGKASGVVVTIIYRTPIATPTVVEGDLFFGQGGDQLNGILYMHVYVHC